MWFETSIAASIPIMLFSLAIALLSNFCLASLELAESLFESLLGRADVDLGARHDPIFQVTPVKLLS